MQASIGLLRRGGRRQIECAGTGGGLQHQLRRPSADGPGLDLALLSQLCEGGQRVFQRRVWISTMAIEQVDTVAPQPLEAALHRPEQGRPAKSDGATRRVEIRLGGDDEVGAIGQEPAEPFLGGSAGIAWRGVDVRDAGIERRSHDASRGRGIDAVAEGRPGAKSDARDRAAVPQLQRHQTESPMTFAGVPQAFLPAGMSALTNDIAPITARSPMVTPLAITLLGPI